MVRFPSLAQSRAVESQESVARNTVAQAPFPDNTRHLDLPGKPPGSSLRFHVLVFQSADRRIESSPGMIGLRCESTFPNDHVSRCRSASVCYSWRPGW